MSAASRRLSDATSENTDWSAQLRRDEPGLLRVAKSLSVNSCCEFGTCVLGSAEGSPEGGDADGKIFHSYVECVDEDDVSMVLVRKTGAFDCAAHPGYMFSFNSNVSTDCNDIPLPDVTHWLREDSDASDNLLLRSGPMAHSHSFGQACLRSCPNFATANELSEAKTSEASQLNCII